MLLVYFKAANRSTAEEISHSKLLTEVEELAPVIVFLEDSLNLVRNFPEIYAQFQAGNFVVKNAPEMQLCGYESTPRTEFQQTSKRNCYLTKPDKSQLVHQLESTLQMPPVTEMSQSPSKASVIDSMVIARKKEYSARSSSFIIYLGEGLKEVRGRCLPIRNGIIEENLNLASHHEEADEKILTHVSHMTLASNVSNAVICSTDTDVVVSALYHFHVTWKNAGIQELWVAFGVGRTL
ncbi:hypothetical protein PR048_005382 [Dryococelus australis]|uniref:Uncharacterized protein n=1 Tax=Dryococelus australis TaxID=614101 RepID=A0ABQ9I849_9NEOP|nr:hypothetical protein PR048_005382 [Dryococelus australis]